MSAKRRVQEDERLTKGGRSCQLSRTYWIRSESGWGTNERPYGELIRVDVGCKGG